MPNKPRRRRRPKDPVAAALNRLADGLTDTIGGALETIMDHYLPTPTGSQRQSQSPHPPHQPHQPPSPPPPPNFYEILEVSESASVETITAAYKSLSSRYHPDNQETGDTNKMQALNNARDVLLDPVKRKTYDALLKRSKR